MTDGTRREGTLARRVAAGAGRLLHLVRSDGSATYVAAVGARTGARALWGLYVPVALSVTAYGRYSVLVTVVTMAVQFAVLGAPQTLVRNAGRRFPTLGILLHSGVLALVGIGAFALLASDSSRSYVPVLLAAVLVTSAYTLLVARAKALFAFTTSLRAELLAALTLLVGLAGLAWRHAGCGEGCATAVLPIAIEAGAAGVAALAFLVSTRTRLTRRELSPRGTTGHLGSVYSVGLLVVLDLVIWRRMEIYFLEHSPSGLTGVAVLGLSVQLASMLLLVPTSLVETWQPRLAIHHRESRDAFASYLRSRERLFFWILAGVVVAGLVLSPLAIMLFFRKYAPWLGYVLALVATRLIFAVAGFYSATLYAIGQERRLYIPVVVGSMVSIASNLALTLRFGLPGALAAYVLTQTTVAVLTIAAFRKARLGSESESPRDAELQAAGALAGS
jgi:O-antigen/teichoic acid export membrane protein